MCLCVLCVCTGRESPCVTLEHTTITGAESPPPPRSAQTPATRCCCCTSRRRPQHLPRTSSADADTSEHRQWKVAG
ncbi:unnamed protein product [Cylicocyclus nassatus]|uniref:Uncharacterized protein n=1 Tax=Cylicocyclus nassatus TaxID=53992 RepID=A0AA36MAJ0_CYLNA|nr:unnamed protein product [Cylicocyclus nassatus]